MTALTLACARASKSPAAINASSSLLRVAAVDDDDARWMIQQRADAWSMVLPPLAACYDIVIVDAPPILLAEPLVAHADHLLALVPLDRPPPASLSSVLDVVVRMRSQTSRLVLDGLVATRFDPNRPAAGRQLESTLALAPARAWIGPPIPEGAGAARAGALDEFAEAWAQIVGLGALGKGGPELVRSSSSTRSVSLRSLSEGRPS